MHVTNGVQIGRVMRFGPRWVDVLTDQGMRRVVIRPGLVVRAGSYLTIIDMQAIAVFTADPRHDGVLE